ncbi:MAG TPA: 4-hydroxy-tetrahydrodipicolinate reductase [bacterium]|nr:4-hydroxy-tetrahydrodipicolinate reductase [bacterium]
MEKTDIVVCGAGGKMGRLIIELAEKSPDLRVRAGIEKNEKLAKDISSRGIEVYADLADIVTSGDVVIDFTQPDATESFIEICTRKKVAAVVGTTGLNKTQHEKIEKAAEFIPLFFAPNMSFGVNLFFEIIRFASSIMKDYETEVSEIHHHFKKDAPSGTAKKIAEIICEASDRKFAEVVKYGRQGMCGSRTSGEIGIHSLRLGDIVGEHYVYFGGKGEIMEFSHRCYNRESFASGALKAAKFLRDKNPGLYNMQDMIKEELKKTGGINVRGK